MSASATLESSTTLLENLREAEVNNFVFNSAVVCPALKALVSEDCRCGRWTALASTTYDCVKTSLDGVADTDADDFYYMSCSQVMAKLVKGTLSKIKSKDPLQSKNRQVILSDILACGAYKIKVHSSIPI